MAAKQAAKKRQRKEEMAREVRRAREKEEMAWVRLEQERAKIEKEQRAAEERRAREREAERARVQKEQEERRAREEREAKAAKTRGHISASSGENDESLLCVICLAADKTHVFVPCGHICCCGRCSDIIMQRSSKICPVCRQACQMSIQTYK